MARTRMVVVGNIITKKRSKVSLFHGESKPWADLHMNLLFKIFFHLSPQDLVSEVSLVCNSWRPICYEASFRKDKHTLDLAPLISVVRHIMCPNIDELPWTWMRVHQYPQKLIEAMECVLVTPLAQCQELITTVMFPRDMHISGLQDLTFVAKRTPNVKRLVLPDGYELKEGCFSEALKHWKFMEEIFFGTILNNHMSHIIQELSINCKNLRKLDIDIKLLGRIYNKGNNLAKLDKHNAMLIAKHLNNLKEFSILSNQVYKRGVRVMLKKCKQVVKLCFKRQVFHRNGTCEILSLDLKKEVAVGREEDVKWRIGSSKSLVTYHQLLHRYIKWWPQHGPEKCLCYFVIPKPL